MRWLWYENARAANSSQVHAPAAKMAPIESPIPFECWGLVGLCDQPSTRNQQLEARGGRLFHEVGRVMTIGADRPIFLEEHYLPLRPTSRHNHQKWDPIHLQLDEGAVYPIPDPASQHRIIPSPTARLKSSAGASLQH